MFMKKFLSTVLFCNFFFLTAVCFSAPGVTVVGVRDNNNIASELPQVDGFANTALQSRINSSISAIVNELKSAVNNNEAIYSYEVVNNNPNFLSMFVKAKNSQGDLLAVKSINLDLRSGDMYNLASFFATSKDFFNLLEDRLGWRPDDNTSFTLSEKGIIFLNGNSEQVIGYENIFHWLIVGKVDYYLDGYKVTVDADGKVVRAKVGNLIILFLEANRTTGYSWYVKDNSYSSNLKYIGSSYLLSSAEIGASGWELMLFGVEKPGEVNIQVEYKRQWEKQSIQNLSITVIGE